MFYYAEGIKLNNKIIQIEKPVKISQNCLVWFFFCIIKRTFTNKIFSINSSLLQKLKNKIPLDTFSMGAIPPGFDEVKLAIYGNENR